MNTIKMFNLRWWVLHVIMIILVLMLGAFVRFQ